MSSPAGGPTVTHQPAGLGGETVTHAAPDQTIPRPASPQFDEDTRVLLWWRLLILHVAAVVIVSVLGLLTAAGELDTPSVGEVPRWVFVAPWLGLAECVGGAVFLYYRPRTSLRGLRLVEFVHFGIAIAGGAFDKAVRLAAVPVDTAPDPILAVGNVATVSQLTFIMIVVVYGTLIPNTRRRTLLVVGLMVAAAFLATVAGAIANPPLRPYLPTMLIVCAVQLTVPTLVAVFVASRNFALRREAFEARRELQQIGQYVLKRKLGAGGMGEVFLAEHRLLKRPCAIKFVRAELASHPSTVARFEREVQAVTGLTHFNTVRVYDYGRADDGAFYYVMEYLDGPTLESLVRDAGPLDPARVVYLLRQVCGALAEAHSHGMVHRDIKPGNLLVAALGGQHDVVKVLDFGLVQDLTTAAGDDRLTMAGVVIGTPAYMAPEQASGEGGLDARCDVYSLGAVAFFALAGRPPFECRTAGQYLTAHMTQAPPRLTDLRPEVPADLAAVVARCLAKNPADRFPNVDELDRALAACECAGSWTAGTAAAWWAATPTRPQPAEGNTTRAHPVGQESPA